MREVAMKEGHGLMTQRRKSNTSGDGPALQVVCLGAGGGPSEDNVTGFLVRSTASNWSKSCMLAVDAGSHLASIVRILEKDFPLVSQDQHSHPAEIILPPSPGGDIASDSNSPDDSSRSPSPETPVTTLQTGPFAGLPFPHASARANALHVVREHVSTYLITHPHLDHLSGFAINTAAFHNTSRPKKLAALPFTVNAIKTHIFNDIIWPNLTDEDNGVGLVTFQRLTEGGNLALGEGTSRGFIEVCNGLAVKGFKVTHGKCASAPRPDHQQQVRRSSNGGPSQQHGQPIHSHNHSVNQQAHADTNKTPNDGGRRSSIFSQPSQPGTPTFYGQQDQGQSIVDSTAFFIRDDATGKEILVFGDVEPDSISLCPRNHIVWAEAANKIAHGLLNGIFIECSYNDSQRDAILFGHLAPRHVIGELQTLAELVTEKKRELGEKAGRKRKRAHASGAAALNAEEGGRRSRSRTHHHHHHHHRESTLSGDELMKDLVPEEHDIPGTPTPAFTHSTPRKSHQAPTSVPQLQSTDSPVDREPAFNPDMSFLSAASSVSTLNHHISEPQPSHEGPLKGVRVIIIHVKDAMADGPLIGDSILMELEAHENRLVAQGRPLGCLFEVSRSGGYYWF